MKKFTLFMSLVVCVLTAMTSCEEKTPFDTYAASGVENGHEYVDLGLSVKWAVDCIEGSYRGDIGGYVEAEYRDELAASWGGKWRVPTEGELWELALFCKWEMIWKDGKSGAKITSNVNGNSIFVPMPNLEIELSDPEHYVVSIWSSEEIRQVTPAPANGTSLIYCSYNEQPFWISDAICAALCLVTE